LNIARELSIDTSKTGAIAKKPTFKKAAKKVLTKAAQKIKARIVKKTLAKVLKYRKKQHYQLILTARFVCNENEQPTQLLEGYSMGRKKGGFPNEREQELMREEAIASIISRYLGGDSECEIIEDTATTEIKEYDPYREGKRLRKARAKAREERK